MTDVLAIAWQTLRTRRATLVGGLIAIWLAVTLAAAAGSLMAAALTAPGAGRFAAADAVVRAHASVTLGHGEDAEEIAVTPAPRLPLSAVTQAAAVPGVAHAYADVSFPVGAWRGADVVRLASRPHLTGHGWDSAVLTPYRLTAGQAPTRRSDVVLEAASGVPVGATLRLVTPSGTGTYRVSGVVHAAAEATRHSTEAGVFFTPSTASTLSGAAGRVNAVGIVAKPGVSDGVLRVRLRAALGSSVDVLDRHHAADADAGDSRAGDKASLVAIFGTMAGLGGAVALFVVAGTFGLAIAQRRRETAVLRALGASPNQIRRMISLEALLVSLVAGAAGLLTAPPVASAIARSVSRHGAAAPGFAPANSWIVPAAALALGVLIAQLAVAAAAWRAGRIRPAAALREVAVEHNRPGLVRVLAGLGCLGGGATMAMLFSGELAIAFSILSALLLAMGAGLLGRPILGLVAIAAAAPLRLLGVAGLLARRNLLTNRWRTAALATPVLLICALAGTQAIVQKSTERHTERTAASRVLADRIVVGRDGAPLTLTTRTELARLPGVNAATGIAPTSVFLLDHGLEDYGDAWAAVGLGGARLASSLDLDVRHGTVEHLRGDEVAVSSVLADTGHVKVGDVLSARMADTVPRTLHVGAIYQRAAGMGDVVFDTAAARRHAAVLPDQAVLVSGGAPVAASLDRYVARHPEVSVLSRPEYLATVRATVDGQAWAVWLIIGLVALFATLGLVNTAAMTTSERRTELATIRIIGGTGGQVIRMIVGELLPIVAAAVITGCGIVGLSVLGVADSVSGVPLAVPVGPVAGILGGAALLGVAAGIVTGRLALNRTSAASALRAGE